MFLKKLIVEFTGCFFIALTLGLSANFIAVGLLVIVLTFLFFSVSGAHFNPAITFCMVLKRRIRIISALAYIAAQFLGVLAAVACFYAIFGRSFVLMPQQNINILKPFIIESAFTFLVVAAYLKVVNNQDYDTKILYLPGSALMVAGLSGSMISGGAFNPALGIGPVFAELYFKSGYPLSHWWVYGLGPITGASAAYLFDTFIYSEKKSSYGA